MVYAFDKLRTYLFGVKVIVHNIDVLAWKEKY